MVFWRYPLRESQRQAEFGQSPAREPWVACIDSLLNHQSAFVFPYLQSQFLHVKFLPACLILYRCDQHGETTRGI